MQKYKKNKIKINLILFLFFFSIFILAPPSIKASAETTNPVEWIKGNWLNYPDDTGKWTTTTINGNPALGSTQNVLWTGYLNTYALDTKDAVFEFKMYQNEKYDDDNMGWTFRHTYTGSYSDIKNHSYYVFVSNNKSINGGAYASGLYRKDVGQTTGQMKLLVPMSHLRAPYTLYNVKIEVKDEATGSRIKIYIDGQEVANYLDTNPLPSGGYGPFSYSQAYAFYYDMNINGSSVYNIPPTLTVTSPAQNTSFNPGSSINLVGSANDVDNRGTLSTYYQIDDGTQQLIWTKTQTGSELLINESIPISSNISYGNHTLTVWAKDSENAESKKTVINFFVNDITKPTATHSITTETDETKTIKIVAKDTESGVKRITLPNGNIINSDSISYNVPNENNDYSFKIEDNSGNFINYLVTVSDVKISPVLEATPNNKEDYINLKWSMSDTWQEYIYNVFKKEASQGEYQSIPAKSTAKVLNIYPEVSETITFTTYDGETLTLPKSASLKMWMESPNSENEKGYGMGLIEVDAVSIDDFNLNPYYYLKDSDGNWKYDSVYQGAWDSNGNKTLSDSAKEAIIELIKSKRGFLTGHDTETEYLNEYLNFDSVKTDRTYASRQLVINKKGFLTNYPWNIGDVGTILNIPWSHSQAYQHPLGDIWLQFYDSTWEASDYSEYNFYLTTWNNVAMIQTGHSNGNATADEQKILANTLFYLSQLTTETELDDRTGQDITPPTNPNITSVVASGQNSIITVNFTASKEQGTTYDYYVQAIGKKNNSKTNSNIESATITSGFKGYSIVVDNSPTTIPDNVVETTSTSYQLSKEITGQFYVHICAVDNAGNKSEVQHYLYSDSFSPSMTLTPNTINWTNGDITIVVNANDNETGVKRIKLPNGTYVSGNTATYTISTNGTYEFVAEDYVGNTFSKSIVVQNIDKTRPTVSHSFLAEPMNGVYVDSTTIKLTTKDTQSGVKRIKLPNGSYVNSSTTNYEVTANGNYTFLVEDNVGNTISYPITVSNLVFKPVLNVTPHHSEDYISLDWSISDTAQPYTYKVFQEKNNSGDFQSISANNLKDKIKVLNIYPKVSPTITFTTYDGETLTLPKSASLKMWMESPNSENEKGYGMGLIEVDAVDLAEFNLNPNKYLKNDDGSWKYDVVFEGSWDSNGSVQLNDTGISALQEFINAGRGFLAGHDTASSSRILLNISSDCIYLGHTEVVIKKKGLLTNYPWNIGDVGTKLKIPLSHVTYGTNAIGKDNWLMYTADTWQNNSAESIQNSDYNYYLMTYNNTAMIQTGHSNGNATSDEQKILANTLFYLSQLTSDTHLDDQSGQDVNAPTVPTITGHSFNNKNITVSFNGSSDIGTFYRYYVEATGQNNGAKTNSDIEETTITSGLKGYSYVIDTNPTTEPDNIIETSTSNNINFVITNKTMYVHLKAIDNVGNVSETVHYKVEDLNKPTLNVTGNATSWTNENITLNVSANDSESGLSYILLPNGNKVTTATTTYTVSANGTYTFKAYDNVGNETIVNVVVSKIDKELPTINYTKEFNANKTSGYINLSVTDSLSGFSKLELPTGEIVTSSSYKYLISNNGMYLFTAWDNVGNESVIGVTVDELNTNNTSSGISKIEYKLSGATTKDWTTYTEPFYITNEGITTITARTYDLAGNISSEVTSQVKIDKTNPINNGIKIELK